MNIKRLALVALVAALGTLGACNDGPTESPATRTETLTPVTRPSMDEGPVAGGGGGGTTTPPPTTTQDGGVIGGGSGKTDTIPTQQGASQP
jgi:hypothetical protein